MKCSPAPPQRATIHFEWIDALRGLSSFAIVLHHVRVDLWVGWSAIRSASGNFSALDQATALLSLPTPFFHSAVMLFFLVSGFCVHLPHAAGRRPLRLSTYARRRLLRIYPPYLAAIALTLAIELFLWARFGLPRSEGFKMVQSVFMLQNYGTGAGQLVSNPSLWSLPVEVELYLAYPLFALLTARFGLKRSLLGATLVSSFVLALAITRDWTGSWFRPTLNFALFWVIWCAGAGLAELVTRGSLPPWRPWMGASTAAALGLAVVATLGEERWPGELQFFAWAAFYLGLLAWGLTRPDPLRVLNDSGREALLGLGAISYSLYLIHFPLFRLWGALWVEAFGMKPSNFLICVAASLLVIPLAWLFHRLIEVPSQRWAKGRPVAQAVDTAAPARTRP